MNERGIILSVFERMQLVEQQHPGSTSLSRVPRGYFEERMNALRRPDPVYLQPVRQIEQRKIVFRGSLTTIEFFRSRNGAWYRVISFVGNYPPLKTFITIQAKIEKRGKKAVLVDAEVITE